MQFSGVSLSQRCKERDHCAHTERIPRGHCRRRPPGLRDAISASGAGAPRSPCSPSITTRNLQATAGEYAVLREKLKFFAQPPDKLIEGLSFAITPLSFTGIHQ